MTAPDQLFIYKKHLTSLCQEVSKFIKAELSQVKDADVETKDMNSLVSYVDKEAERMIVDSLTQLTPEAGFITEEDTVDQTDKALTWIVDPLDGTTNFLQKIPHFSISIALMEDRKISVGIVYEIMLDTAYTAIRGEGAWEGTKKMTVSAKQDMSTAIVVTGFPYRKDIDIDVSLAILKYCVMHCRGVRRLGSAALDLAYVASGKIDIYYENALNIWDIAAGALLIQEAGGSITDYQGGDQFLNGTLISSNGHLQSEIQTAIRSCQQKG